MVDLSILCYGFAPKCTFHTKLWPVIFIRSFLKATNQLLITPKKK